MATKPVTKTKPAAAALPSEPKVEIFDFEQGSPEWNAARCGIPTASNFSKIMAQSAEQKGRARYLRDLAGERITGCPAETFRDRQMERGNSMEDRVRSLYIDQTFDKVTRVGFVRCGKFGCSPDSFVGDEGGLEIKTMIPALMIELIETGKIPGDHRAQIQGNLWITGRKWWDLVIGYAPDAEAAKPMPLLKWRFVRDEVYIKELRDACEVFELDVRRMVERIQKHA